MRTVPAPLKWAWVAALLAAMLVVAVELSRVTSRGAIVPVTPRAASSAPPVAEGELLGVPEVEAIQPSAAPVLTR